MSCAIQKPLSTVRKAVTCTRAKLVARRSIVPMAASAPVTHLSVSDTMASLKAEGKTALVPFICAGDPDLDTTAKALLVLDQAGCDVIELGVPYSDPLADGPTIQAAADRALSKKTTLESVINMLASVSSDIKAPIILFTYFNPIMARGLDKFCKDIKAAGGSGLLVPDIPLEETTIVREACNAHGLELTLLTTPATDNERMERIAAATEGFLYLVSVNGVTGVRSGVEGRVQDLIKTIKEKSDKPVNVGFGVSEPEQAQLLKEWGADGVIVGSALVKQLGEAASPQEGLDALKTLITRLRAAV